MTENKEITERLKTAGYKMEASIHCDNFDGRKGQAIWDIRITRNGREHTMQYHNAVIARYFSNGRSMKHCHLGPPLSVDQLAVNKCSKPMRPTYADVFYCWLADTRCVCNGESFEKFCDEFGFDTYSRRALACYNGCVEQWQGMLRLGVDFDEFDLLFEDF